jgi:tetratricopeptide (TPR) repeat protein
MSRAWLMLGLLLAGCFSLATYLQPRQAAREQAEGRTGGVLTLLLGDGRKMFANEFFAKADAYFHRGNYPSIFDEDSHQEENHMTEAASGGADSEAGHEELEEKLPPPRDFIERFGRHFYPTEHVHLHGGEEQEMLPWLRLSADMDPHRVETYAVTAYWLRKRLGMVAEAEQFLREGLRSNPGDPELLYQLGLLYLENHKNLTRAHNLWMAALPRWEVVEGTKEKPNQLLHEEILIGLARIEAHQAEFGQAIEHLKQLKLISPSPEEIQRQIDALETRVRESSTQ